MFQEPWLWLTWAAFLFVGEYQYWSNKGMPKGVYSDVVAGLALLGLFVFWIIGFFCAAHWWQPLVAAVFAIFTTGIAAGLLPAFLTQFLGKIGGIVGLILTVVAYIMWY